MMMTELERPLAPPLPPVLRPPLRKKKSFSGRRVSRWLFPGTEGEGQGVVVGGSVTNAPRPVRGGEGFYQSVSSSESSESSEESGEGGDKGESGWETESGGTTPRVGKGEEAGRRGAGQRGSVGVAF